MPDSFDFETGQAFYLYAFKARPRPTEVSFFSDTPDPRVYLHASGICGDDVGACFLLRPPKELQGDVYNDGSRLEKRLLASLLLMCEENGNAFSFPGGNLKEIRLAKDEAWAIAPEKARAQGLKDAETLRAAFHSASRRPETELKKALPPVLKK